MVWCYVLLCWRAPVRTVVLWANLRLCRIEHNLALWTRTSSSLLDTDTTPASFWITFPTNFFVNNTAAGSDRYGFWFDLQEHPTGPSADVTICPPGEPLGSFEHNTAHSNVRYGVRIFNNWVPVHGDACNWRSPYAQRTPNTARLMNYTGYKNGRSGPFLCRAFHVCSLGSAFTLFNALALCSREDNESSKSCLLHLQGS
jgi:hypothetical protein